MKHRSTSAWLLATLLLAGSAGDLWAQEKVYRPEGTVFIKPKIGLSNYFGDNERSPTNFNNDAFSIGTPIGLAAEVGYQLSVPFSLSFAVVYGNYPVITQFPPPEIRDDDMVAEDPSSRTSLQAFGRYTFAESRQRTAPYINFGLVASFGTARQKTMPCCTTEESAFAFGPLVGVGVDIAMNGRTSFFAEFQSGLHFGDDQLDGNADNGAGPMDILSGIGLGFKINLTSAVTPVGVASLTCPTGNVLVGEDAPFSMETNPAATLPVSILWIFGDGGTATGGMVTHAFGSDGTFTVTVTATNEAGPASATCSVTIVEPAQIVTFGASGTTVSICDDDPSVTFSPNLRGSQPLAYNWDFGDGNTSDEAMPAHSWAESGTYTVVLELTNAGGSDRQTITVEVTEEGCWDCDISSMNSVFFGRNSSVLSEEARQFLLENVEILQNCEFGVRIEGHASRDERRSSQLSEDRARAVAQFYMDQGIAEDRMTHTGMGTSGQTTKKTGASQFRRVDTIPDTVSEEAEGESEAEPEEGQ